VPFPFAFSYIYIFTSPSTLSDPTEAVSKTVAALPPGPSTYTHVWLDIEQCSGCWKDSAANEAYIQKVAAYAKSRGLTVGIYSSPGEWPTVRYLVLALRVLLIYFHIALAGNGWIDGIFVVPTVVRDV
jgi:hypothetical protein